MHVQRIQARETNCYLLHGKEGIVLVDPGPPSCASRVISSAEESGVRAADVRLILVTHGHLDHYGAVPEIKAWSGAPVAAHTGAPAFSQDRRNALPPAQTARGSLVRWFYLLLSPLARFAPLEAGVPLGDGADLAGYGLDARTIHLPGHSPGSIGVKTADGDLVAGDLFVNYTVPSQPIYLWDRAAWEQSYERVKGLGAETVHVGHGDPFSGSDLGRIHPARYQMRWWVR